MIDLTKDLFPLTDFNRNPGQLIQQLKETGRPLVLTVNGKAEVVVLDVASYQRFLETIDRAEASEKMNRMRKAAEKTKRISSEKGKRKNS